MTTKSATGQRLPYEGYRQSYFNSVQPDVVNNMAITSMGIDPALVLRPLCK